VGVLWSFVCQLRLVEDGRLGIVALASLVAVVKAGDVGAYAFGRLLGRNKMAPILSPGKTWAGLVGGLFGSCLGAWVTLGWWLPQWSPPTQLLTGPGWWVPYGLVVGLAGVAGDLAESMLKRDAGVKDSSTWMPGFGGVLDMVDSIIFAAPVAWICWAIWLLRP
jgi:phosphatidate cytidylyltransferase